MRAIIGFLLGAAACAMVTTERGRRLCDDLADELTEQAKRALKEHTTITEEVKHDDGEGNAHVEA